MAIFSTLSGIVAGGMAAGAQERAANAAANTQREMYQANLRLLAPQYQVGQSALFQMADLYGLDRPAEYTDMGDVMGGYPVGYSPKMISRLEGGRGRESLMAGGGGMADMGALTTLSPEDRRAAAMEKFYTSPDYSFRMAEGLKALDRSAAARGNLLSGGQLKAAQAFGGNLASAEFGNYWDRLAKMAGYGSSATGTATTLGANTASNIGNAQMEAGAARASGYLTGAQAFQAGLQNTMNLYAMKGGFGGGGGTQTTQPFNVYGPYG